MSIKKYKMIYYFDIYGSNINLYYKNNKIFKTKIGSILGIISIIIFVFIFFYLFSFLFKRNIFNIINNYEINLDSSINFNNVPVFFGLINKNGEVIKYNKKVFTFYLHYFEQIIHSNLDAIQNITTLNLSECNKNIHFKDYTKIFQNYTNEQISKFMCISKNNNIDLILKGNVDSNIFSKIILTIEKCVNTTNYSECYDSNTINSILDNSKLYFGYLGYNINHFSYKNPLKRELRYKLLPLSNYFYKKFNFFYNHCKYQSDNGLILSSYKTMNFFELETYNSDILDFLNGSQILSEIEISVNENNRIYIRKYQKLQECFTIIKSTIDIIYIFIKIFYSYFIDKYEILDMADNLIIKKIIKKNQSNFSNNINNISLSLIKIKQNNNLNNDFKIPLKHKTFTRINKRKNYTLVENISKEIIIDDKSKKYILNEKINLKWYYYFFPIIFYNIKNKELKKFVLFKNILNENLSLENMIKIELNNINYENIIS